MINGSDRRGVTGTGRQIPRATAALIIINTAVFFLAEIISGSTQDTAVLITWGGAWVPAVREGEYWRLLTSIFMHSGIRHLLNNMLMLYVLGSVLEELLGCIRYVILYLASGIISGYITWHYYYTHGRMVVAVGASGAIFAVMGALLFIILCNKGRVRGLSLRQIAVMLLLSLYVGFTSPDVSNMAHISGAVTGFLLAVPMYLAKPRALRR